jgi:hypothetical protein
MRLQVLDKHVKLNTGNFPAHDPHVEIASYDYPCIEALYVQDIFNDNQKHLYTTDHR